MARNGRLDGFHRFDLKTIVSCICDSLTKPQLLNGPELSEHGNDRVRIFGQRSCDVIPIEDCTLKGHMGLNGELDLMEGEGEFAPGEIRFAERCR